MHVSYQANFVFLFSVKPGGLWFQIVELNLHNYVKKFFQSYIVLNHFFKLTRKLKRSVCSLYEQTMATPDKAARSSVYPSHCMFAIMGLVCVSIVSRSCSGRTTLANSAQCTSAAYCWRDICTTWWHANVPPHPLSLAFPPAFFSPVETN